MSVVDEAVEDRVGEGGVTDGFVPVLEGELAGDQGGLPTRPVLDDLKEIAAFDFGEGDEAEVVEDEESGLLKPVQKAGPGAVGTGQGQLFQQTTHAEVAGGESVPAGGLGQRAGDEGLSGSGRPSDEDHLVLADPVAGGETEEDGSIEAARGTQIHVLDAGRESKTGLAQETREATVLPGHGLPLHQEAEPVFKGELMDVGQALLLLEGGGHGVEAEVAESGEGRFEKHDRSLQFRGA